MRFLRCFRNTLVGALLLSGCASPSPPTVAHAVSVSPIELEPDPSDWVRVTKDDPQTGRKLAPLTLVVFSDYQCPYCRKFDVTLRALQAEYADLLRIVWKDMPLRFHRWARPAAVAGRVAFALRGADSFDRVRRGFFARQSELSTEVIAEILSTEGIGPAEFESARVDAERKVDQSLAEAASLKVDGTPASLINGEKVVGGRPIAELREVLDRHLSKVEAFKATGVLSHQMYARLVREFGEQPKSEEEESAAFAASFTEDVYRIPVGMAPVRGPADAKITIVVFTDFQCPYCRRYAATLESLRTEFKDQIRVVVRHHPLDFHSDATAAAYFAMEARSQGGEEAFFAAYDAIFASKDLSRTSLLTLGRTLNLDEKRVVAALDATPPQYLEVLRQDLDLADDGRVVGTPKSFVNGVPVGGAVSLSHMRALVRRELLKAAERLKAGTPQAKLYESIIAAGRGDARKIDEPALSLARTGVASSRLVTKTPTILHVFSDFADPVFVAAILPHDGKKKDSKSSGEEQRGLLPDVLATYGDKVRIVLHLRADDTDSERLSMAYAVASLRGPVAGYQTLVALAAGVKLDTIPKLAKIPEKALNEAIAKGFGADIEAGKIRAIDAEAGKFGMIVGNKLLRGPRTFAQLKLWIDVAIAANSRAPLAKPAVP